METVANCVIPYVHDRDRDSVSLVCGRWYEIDCMTRKHVTVHLHYAPTPLRLSQRFPFLESLTLKGYPCEKGLLQKPGVNITPWIRVISVSFRCLKSLHVRNLAIHDSDLELLARTRGKDLKVLKIVECEGISENGLMHISKGCNELKTLCLDLIDLNREEGCVKWLHELALRNAGIETFSYKEICDQLDVKDVALLVKNCSKSLVSLMVMGVEVLFESRYGQEFLNDGKREGSERNDDVGTVYKSHKVLGIAPVAIIDRQSPFEYTITSRSTDVVVTVGELHAMLIEYAKVYLKGENPKYMMIKGGKIYKSNKKSLKAKGKMTRKSFPHHPERATDLLGIIHTDVCGPLRHVSRQGASYFITFTDDYSRYGYVYLLKHKHEVFETFKVFKNEVENQLGKTIKALRSDRGGEYISQEFKDYLKACGIVQQLTPPYTPQHNGVSERRNRTLLDMVRSMMNLTTLVILFGIMLRVWGCKALVKRDTPDKLQQRYVKYVEFFEKNLIPQKVSGRDIDLEEIQDEDTSPSEITSEIPIAGERFLNHSRGRYSDSIDNMVWVLVYRPLACKTVGVLLISNHPEKYASSKIHFGLKQAADAGMKICEEIKREATFILGIKIYRDRSKRLIRLGQNAYMDKILKRYKMDNSERGHIPMQERLDLNKTQGASTPEEVKRMQNVPYASVMGSIVYAVRCTRPDVAFAQNIISRFQQNPGEPHWTAVKNILKYLRNTKDMFLVYGGNPEAELRVDCYCDAGFETDRDDTKSKTGYVFILNGGVVD
ncbi:retrotransposon protein, putative, ty1-copia subclass [Tanacetum coccineum]